MKLVSLCRASECPLLHAVTGKEPGRRLCLGQTTSHTQRVPQVSGDPPLVTEP